MTRTGASLAATLALAIAIVWALALTAVFTFGWSDTRASIARQSDDARRGCAGRYSLPDARKRCEDLFDVQYVIERNTALATRALIAGGPLAALAAWAWWRRGVVAAAPRRPHPRTHTRLRPRR